MATLIFTYGTLKQGFANFHVNEGRRVPGEFETVQCYPLVVIGPWFVPWLVNAPGTGSRVAGQLFEVDDAGLARMDGLERVSEPGWYTREAIDVRERDRPDAAPRRVQVYFGDAGRVSRETVHAGPLAEFTAELDARYRRP